MEDNGKSEKKDELNALHQVLLLKLVDALEILGDGSVSKDPKQREYVKYACKQVQKRILEFSSVSTIVQNVHPNESKSQSKIKGARRIVVWSMNSKKDPARLNLDFTSDHILVDFKMNPRSGPGAQVGIILTVGNELELFGLKMGEAFMIHPESSISRTHPAFKNIQSCLQFSCKTFTQMM